MNGDEVNLVEETNEVKALQDELESIRRELEGLKREKETLTGELLSRDARISELEQTMAELDEKFNSVSESLNQAVSSYKALVVEANPGIIEELISGDSIEQINESVDKVKSLIGRVKKELEVEASKTRVPAGAPERTSLDLSALSSREKIRYAIGGKR